MQGCAYNSVHLQPYILKYPGALTRRSTSKDLALSASSSQSKSVLITGGAHRLGAAITRGFAAQGWQVFCHYQRSGPAAQALVDELRQQGARAFAVQGDLADPEQIEPLMAQVRAHTHELHCLVNNASMFEPDTGDGIQVDRAQALLQVNLMAPLLLGERLVRDVLPAQPHGDPACIIHILDQKVYNLNPDYFSYTLSKLALERAVALQAQALAPRVRVCGLAPGLLFTSGPQTDDNFARAQTANLLRRPIAVADVVDACLFLAKTTGVTGSTVCVDNGQHLVPLPRDIMFVVDELLAAPKGNLS